MPETKKYMAASVPRFIRQTKLGYLPLNCIIGSRLVEGEGGANLFFDIVMLPVKEFQRMKMNVGLQHVLSLELKPGPSFSPVYMPTDMKEVIVPADERDAEEYARNYFLKAFDLLDPDAPG